MKNQYIKSPLNYTGGKHKLLPQLIPLFPKGNGNGKFVDLFCGGGNVVANVNGYKTRVANDIDDRVIGIFNEIQNRDINYVLDYIKHKIDKYGLNLQDADAYNRFRSDYNEGSRDPLNLFILICYSFNHQIRFNKLGEFNMPFGKDRSCYNPNIEKNLIAFSESIKDVRFVSKSFTELNLNKMNDGDFVYCDPPYLITCASYNEQDGWNGNNEIDLLLLLDKLHEKGVYFGLSNVLSNKGKENVILKEWFNARKNKYVIHHLNHSYSNCSYHAKDRESISDEVYITNYNGE